MLKRRESARSRRARRTRKRIRESGFPRLCVHRTPRHIYAQVFSSDGGNTVASASTVEREVRKELAYGGNAAAAEVVGQKIAERTLQAGIFEVAFDRSGFRFHGRVRVLAQAARGVGLKF